MCIFIVLGLTLRKTSGDEGWPSSLTSLQERGELFCPVEYLIPLLTLTIGTEQPERYKKAKVK